MRGTYIIKQNGQEIGRGENIITTEGKKQIAKSLAFQNTQWASKVALGAGGAASSANGLTAPASSDKFLDFEFTRLDILSISLLTDIPAVNQIRLVAKTLIPENIAGIISEIGIFSSSINPDNFEVPIANCKVDELWEYINASGTLSDTEQLIPSPHISSGTFLPKIGPEALYINNIPTYSSSKTIRIETSQDFSGAAESDSFILALNKTNTTSSSIQVKFCVDANNYFYQNISSTSSGYQIVSRQKSQYSASVTGTPSWDAITYIEFVFTGNYEIYLDGVRVKRAVSDDQNILVSRTFLSSSVSKIEGVPLEIEYYLDLFTP